MCYAIPAQITAINGSKATISYFGEERQILLDLDDVKVGDYIYAQGGISVRKIAAQEAEEVLKVWREVFFELKKTDQALAQIDTKNMPTNALGVLQKINLQKSFSRAEMLALYQLHLPEQLSVLYEIANNVRAREHGNASCVHGIIEFSNCCGNDCHYCGIRATRTDLTRYRFSVDEIISIAKNAVDQYGFKALVLQSGEDFCYDDEQLVAIVKAVRALGTLVFLSVGVRPIATYEKLYQAGARAALMRFETSNAELFARLRPKTTLAERLELIRALRKIGYILATGFMVGLPGESDADLINNIFLTKALGPDMYSFGPFLPTKNTPLAHAPSGSVEQVLKVTAIARFVDPQANILVTTALETLDPSAKRTALLAGANSLMINVTPEAQKRFYNIYDERVDIKRSLAESIQSTTDLLYSLGRAPTDLSIAVKNEK